MSNIPAQRLRHQLRCRRDLAMFSDASIVGSWPALANHLDASGSIRRWAAVEPELQATSTVAGLLDAWRDSARTDGVLSALVRLAAVDGGRDDDALLLILHLLSGLVRRLARQLGDLSPDIHSIVLAELTCQVRRYPWRRRRGGVVANLYAETRRAVLAELRPSDRYHPDRVEALTDDGDVARLADRHVEASEDLDVVDLLRWAVRGGVPAHDVALLVETECARDRRLLRADEQVAAAYGMTSRTLYRRRERTLTALRGIAPQYLAAIA